MGRRLDNIERLCNDCKIQNGTIWVEINNYGWEMLTVVCLNGDILIRNCFAKKKK